MHLATSHAYFAINLFFFSFFVNKSSYMSGHDGVYKMGWLKIISALCLNALQPKGMMRQTTCE